MKIYTAALYSRREEILGYAKQLEDAGHEITARWTKGDEEGKSLEDIAVMDLEDVLRAEMTLVFTNPYGSFQKGGGRHTELGLAYASGKMVWIVGEKEQVFHSLPRIRQFNDVETVVEALKAFDEVKTLQKFANKGLQQTEELLDKGMKYLRKFA